MPTKKIIELYTIDELKNNKMETALRLALDQLRDETPMPEQWDVDDLVENECKPLGYLDAGINYTGFWSQGDGASFTATVDLPAFLKRCPPKNSHLVTLHIGCCNIKASIIRGTSRYYHENTVHCDVTWEGCDEIMKNRDEGDVGPNDFDMCRAIDDLTADIDDDSRRLMKKIYRLLEDEYEFQTQDEQLEETARANEYLFTDKGIMSSI